MNQRSDTLILHVHPETQTGVQPMDLKMFAAIRPGTPEYPPTTRARLADWYHGQIHDPTALPVRQAYETLWSNLLNQYDDFVYYNVGVFLTDTDPYESSDEMVKDTRTGRLMVLATPDDGMPEDHPMMQFTLIRDNRNRRLRRNDVFRAVHDMVHAMSNTGFSWRGELQASRVHASLCTTMLSRRALLVETIAQNACYFESGTTTLDRKFVQQKACIATEAMVAAWYGLPVA